MLATLAEIYRLASKIHMERVSNTVKAGLWGLKFGEAEAKRGLAKPGEAIPMFGDLQMSATCSKEGIECSTKENKERRAKSGVRP